MSLSGSVNGNSMLAGQFNLNMPGLPQMAHRADVISFPTNGPSFSTQNKARTLHINLDAEWKSVNLQRSIGDIPAGNIFFDIGLNCCPHLPRHVKPGTRPGRHYRDHRTN